MEKATAAKDLKRSLESSSVDDGSDICKRRSCLFDASKMWMCEDLASKCINTIRCLGAELPQLAKSGHPGAPMGCAPMAHVLWGSIMNYSPRDPMWMNRDRFILSNGHACALLYSMLHLTGYESVTRTDLEKFRQLHSSTPGHPESFVTAGVEICTGPLGQGLSNGVGMAIAERHLAKKYNRSPEYILFDNYVYVICGDGCLQEGVTAEASSLAGHLGLGRLIVLYDDNEITIDGSTSLSFTENLLERYLSYGWHVQVIENGDSQPEEILACIMRAKEEMNKPSIIKIKTTIGFGSSKEGTAKTHGAPLGDEDLKNLKHKFGVDVEKSLDIPEVVMKFYRGRGEEGNEKAAKWKRMFEEYSKEFVKEGEELKRRFAAKLPEGWKDKIMSIFNDETTTIEATRQSSSKCLNVVASFMPELIGGSADLSGSNLCLLKGEDDFQKEKEENRYIRYGVREHAMAAISNGMLAYGAFRPFAATFLNFLTYAWGAVRISALARLGVLYIATHDSIELGEDGPTHQPIEAIPLIRATPNLLLLRPADGRETSGAYGVWLENITRPSVLALCRGNTPTVKGTDFEKVRMGGYVVEDFGSQTMKNEEKKKMQIVLAASGTELKLCIEAKKILEKCYGYDVRVVSMVCWELFAEQTEEYRHEVLCLKERKEKKVITTYVEAASPLGWGEYFDVKIGMTTFGASGKQADLCKEFGFTKENVVEKTLKYMEEQQM